MKQRYYIGLAVGLAAAATWAGRAAWRAHKDIVTLHVRAMPLADVIGHLERQTRERIVTDLRLNANVTLDVDNLPLTDVLDRIADQAGGLMTTIHAVYESQTALGKLLAALRTGDIGSANGWTNIAPRLPSFKGKPDAAEMNLDPHTPGEDSDQRQVATVDRDGMVRHGGDKEEPLISEDSGPIMVFRGSSRGGGGPTQEEMIVPERIVIESALETLLKPGTPLSPSYDTALAVARQVRGQSKTLYALRKSAAGSLGASVMRQFRSELSSLGSPEPSKDRVGARPGPPSLADAERGALRANLSRFQNLTPEQRAQRARERHDTIDKNEP